MMLFEPFALRALTLRNRAVMSPLTQRLRLDAPLNAPDPSTFYTPGAQGYTDYPVLAAA